MSYAERKERARQMAMDWQNSFAEGATYYWSDMAEAGERFEKLGRRYGLLNEFRENGIC